VGALEGAKGSSTRLRQSMPWKAAYPGAMSAPSLEVAIGAWQGGCVFPRDHPTDRADAQLAAASNSASCLAPIVLSGPEVYARELPVAVTLPWLPR
jgi:hypothetical protein